MHIIAGKAVALQDRPVRGVPRAPAAHARGRARRWPRRCSVGGRQRAHRRHRRAPGAGRPARVRARRQAGRGPAARDRHHRQPQRGAVRPAAAGGSSGLRIGTPALATRGLQVDDFREVGQDHRATRSRRRVGRRPARRARRAHTRARPSATRCTRSWPRPPRPSSDRCGRALPASGVSRPGRCMASSQTARASSRPPVAGRRSATQAGPAVGISPWIGAMPWWRSSPSSSPGRGQHLGQRLAAADAHQVDVRLALAPGAASRCARPARRP